MYEFRAIAGEIEVAEDFAGGGSPVSRLEFFEGAGSDGRKVQLDEMRLATNPGKRADI